MGKKDSTGLLKFFVYYYGSLVDHLGYCFTVKFKITTFLPNPYMFLNGFMRKFYSNHGPVCIEKCMTSECFNKINQSKSPKQVGQ